MAKQEEGNPPAGITAWWDGLVSGIVGKVALLSIVPFSLYVSNSISSFKDETETRHEEVSNQLRELSEVVRSMQYQQGELTRHVIVIERRLLGYSTLGGANATASNGVVAPVDTPLWQYTPALPQPVQPPLAPERDPRRPDPSKDTPATIPDRERRRLGVEGIPR